MVAVFKRRKYNGKLFSNKNSTKQSRLIIFYITFNSKLNLHLFGLRFFDVRKLRNVKVNFYYN